MPNKAIPYLADLKVFPAEKWAEEPSRRWLDLCTLLRKHHPKIPAADAASFQRKWEYVSAYQKCVRRGLLDQAICLLGRFHSIFRSQPKEKAYFWRRICTTACEDVGYGDPELMNFVLACSTLFTPSKVTDQQLLTIWSFLTEQMCETQKSRIYCQCSIMEGLLRQGVIPEELDTWEASLIAQISARAMETPRQKWAAKNTWRGEGMVHFQHLVFATLFSEEELPPFETISELPDFSFDMHTRVGIRALRYLSEHAPFRQYLAEHPSKLGDSKTLGWSLFFAEGGKIQDRLYYSRLDLLESKFIACQFGWQIKEWWQLVKFMDEAVSSGKLNNLRKNILRCMPYSEIFQTL